MIGALRPLSPAELAALRANPARTRELVGAKDEVSLEKMWEALHHTLCGSGGASAGPLAKAVLGGTDIGPDLGYGPARYLTPDEVREVDRELTKLTRDEMRRRFKPADLAARGTYPQVWDEPEEDLFDEIRMYFDDLAACYRKAAAAGNGMLLSVT